MKRLAILFSSILTPLAVAGVIPYKFQPGATIVSDDGRQIVIHSAKQVTVSTLPGGGTWPRLSLDRAGKIYAGNVVIDAVTGKLATHADTTLALPNGVDVKVMAHGYQFRRAGKSCDLFMTQLG